MRNGGSRGTRVLLGLLATLVAVAVVGLGASATSAAVGVTFTVNSTGDADDANLGDGLCADATGRCTLRAAIAQSNASAGFKDTIAFDLPSPSVIAVASNLPPITNPVIIDATTQPGFLTRPVVELRGDGQFNGPTEVGLAIVGPGESTVCGLAIDGFWHSGIELSGGSKNEIEGNYVGLDAGGLSGLGHAQWGINMHDSGANVIGVGATTEHCHAGVKPNVIAGNARNIGVSGFGAISDGNRIAGNYVGTDATGMVGVGGQVLEGILIESSNNKIGGTTPIERNIVSGSGEGIRLLGSGNAALGNFVGTNATGAAAIPNSSNGIEVRGPKTTIGGPNGTTPGGACTGACNLVSGNEGNGIVVSPGQVGVPATTLIVGNYIGVDRTGTLPLGNGVLGFYGGVFISDSGTVVGGVNPAARNVISGNKGYGIVLQDGNNTIEGSFVGTDTTGQHAIGNAAGGIFVVGDKSRIGGAGAGQGNLIAFNGTPLSLGAGVFLGGNLSTVGNAILRNSIFDNAGLGIDLNPGGPNPNDAGDADEGPNHLQNFPEVQSAVSDGTTIKIAGTLSSTPNRSGYRLEFFANDACDLPAPVGSFGEGKTFLGFKTVMTNGSGEAPFTATFPLAKPLPSNAVIAATATDPDQSTSEFSECRNVAQGDTTPPTCVIKQVVNGPPKQLIIKTQDTGSGLKSIVVDTSTNALTVVPPFVPGTTAEVDVDSKKINQSQNSVVKLTVTDVAANVTVCDPVLSSVTIRRAGQPSRQTYRHLARSESTVRLINSKPGIRTVALRVNGHALKQLRLASGQTRIVNVARWMRRGDNNTITLIARGAVGTSATILISD
jgi:CSLREA domain-containing protein